MRTWTGPVEFESFDGVPTKAYGGSKHKVAQREPKREDELPTTAQLRIRTKALILELEEEHP
jgi:hypothetical protein